MRSAVFLSIALFAPTHRISGEKLRLLKRRLFGKTGLFILQCVRTRRQSHKQ